MRIVISIVFLFFGSLVVCCCWLIFFCVLVSVKLFNKFNECCPFHGGNLANENQNDDCDTGDDKHSSLYFFFAFFCFACFCFLLFFTLEFLLLNTLLRKGCLTFRGMCMKLKKALFVTVGAI